MVLAAGPDINPFTLGSERVNGPTQPTNLPHSTQSIRSTDSNHQPSMYMWPSADEKGDRKNSNAFKNRLNAFESRLNAFAFFSDSSFSSGRSHIVKWITRLMLHKIPSPGVRLHEVFQFSLAVQFPAIVVEMAVLFCFLQIFTQYRPRGKVYCWDVCGILHFFASKRAVWFFFGVVFFEKRGEDLEWPYSERYSVIYMPR